LLSQKQLKLWQWVSNECNEFSRKQAVEALGFPQRTVESILKETSRLKAIRTTWARKCNAL